jgi:predicted hydrocarbon binding protein
VTFLSAKRSADQIGYQRKKERAMMGVICNMVLDFATELKGTGTRDTILKRLERSEEFNNGKIYSEEDFQKLLLTTCEVCGADANTAEVEFGKFAGRTVATTFSGYFETSENSRALFKKVPAIHTQYPILAAGGHAVDIYPSAKITILKDTEQELIYCYNSPNKLCTFLKSLATWVSQEYYKENVEIEETQCAKQGAEFCRIVIRWQ